MDFISSHFWLILFLLWGLPLTLYRSRFRKLVYRTDSWTINIEPRFGLELKALFGNLYPDDKQYVACRNFYRFYLLVYTILFVLYMALSTDTKNEMNKIEVGSVVPPFALADQNGQMVDVGSYIGRQKMVIYFYPKDDTPGCTRQACSFRDQYELFKNAGAEVFGISGQSVGSHKKFAEKYHLSFPLLSDQGNRVRKLFGVPSNLFGILPGRVTYIIDQSGHVVSIFNSQTEAERHIEEALRTLNEIP